MIGTYFGYFITAWTFIKKVPWLLNCLKNWKEIEKILKSTFDIYKSATANGGLPTCDDTRKMLENIEIIFKNKFVDIEGVDELMFAENIREIKEMIVCQIDRKGPKQ